jgi:hypothetical protein
VSGLVRHTIGVVSAVIFLTTAAWTCVALSCGTNRFAWNFLLHHPSFAVSNGETVSGTTGYSLVTDAFGLTLWYTDMCPLFSAEKTTDGRPILLLADPIISTPFRLPLRSMLLVCAAAAVPPTWWLWTIFRRRRKTVRGFPVVCE